MTTAVYAATTASSKPIKMPAIKGKPTVTKLAAPPKLTGVLKELDDLTIDVPVLDLSASPIPDLKLSSLAVLVPELPSRGEFKNLATPVDTAVQPEVNIEIPALDIEMPTTGSEGATGGVVAAPETGAPTGETGGAPSGSQGGSQSTEVNATNCAQFASMPSVQYCSSVADPNGATLCTSCKNGGF
ncbi:MAG: hypothetical protein PHT12_03265 [Patescibacteria group bacterium]|nr:hypothetical protein [Patescibacteria group bacterium]